MSIESYIDPTVSMIELAELSPDPEQPRDHFDEDEMDALEASIKVGGIITPLLYRIDGDKKIIVSGERRYKAATALKLPEVPAQLVLRDYQLVALFENIQRNSLTAMEEAIGLSRLEEAGMSRPELMKKFGKAESTISEILKPAELPEDIRKEALSSAFWSRNKLLKLAKTQDKDKKKGENNLLPEFGKMKAAVDKKKFAKERKRKERLTGKRVQPEKTEGQSTQKRSRADVYGRKIQDISDVLYRFKDSNFASTFSPDEREFICDVLQGQSKSLLDIRKHLKGNKQRLDFKYEEDHTKSKKGKGTTEKIKEESTENPPHETAE